MRARHAALLAAIALAAAAAAAATLRPVLPRAVAGTQCVEDPERMRSHHMEFLRHTRDRTVQGGIRGARHSLTACIGCHATSATGSVYAAAGDFCVACHQYAAVKIDCFDCHYDKPDAPVGGQP